MNLRVLTGAFFVLLGLTLVTAPMAFAEKGTDRAKDKQTKKDKAEKPKAEEEAPEASPTENPESLKVTNHYVERWIAMPTFEAQSLSGNNAIALKPERGYASVVFFLASWCEACQKITPHMLQLEKKYSKLYTHFYWVFSHDTSKDAMGFSKEYKLGGNTALATQDILKTFHNPELPTIYVGDRQGWLATRFEKADDQALDKLDEFLQYITGV